MINLAYCVYLLLMARLEKKRKRGRERSKKWTLENPEKRRAIRRKYREANPDKVAQWDKENPERRKEISRNWARKKYARDPESQRAITRRHWRTGKPSARFKARRVTDPGFKLLENLRCRLGHALRGTAKAASTRALIGCSISELRLHLEKQFQPGMTWENHGPLGWHVDHIRPCASFDFTDLAQQRECFHFSNLQPLWAIDNIKKGDTYVNPS